MITLARNTITLFMLVLVVAGDVRSEEPINSASLISSLMDEQQCNLKLICVVSKYGDSRLKESRFVGGIRALSNTNQNFNASKLALALRAGNVI